VRFLRQSNGLGLISTLFAIGAFAQTPAVVRPTFEVAAIKPSTTPFMQALTDGSLIGIAITPGHVRIGHLTLSNLILTAYNIKAYQLESPNSSTMFDIDAKLPEGATPDQVPLMLQTLLADRFKLTIRRGSKQVDTYALVAGKSGPKLQKKEPPSDADTPPKLDSSAAGVKDEKGRTNVVMGRAKLTIERDGAAHVETSTVAGIMDYLSIRISPLIVVDKTELQGDFDIKMDLPPNDLSGLRTGALDPAELQARTMDQLSKGLDKLGLKLEQQKSLVETIIVEHAEKLPTDN